MCKKKYFITGGGTGGHIYPAIAIADELLTLENTEKVYYVGNPNNLEFSIVKDKNYEFLPVISSGMPRKFSLSFIKWAISMFFAWIKCCFYVKKYKPDIIFGTGGYVSAPVLLAGITMKIPFVMHDCDANPGLVTRKLSPFASGISIAFDVAKTQLHNQNCFVNGNPIRKEFSTVTKSQAKKIMELDETKPVLCVMGGSQGAKKINFSIVKILKTLSQDLNIQVIFQTGKKNYDETISELKQNYPEFENDKNLIIRPYFDNMPAVLKSSDIAISRAGSLSISELCASAVATIFIPYPHAAADHQRKNAQYMVDCGAGLYLEDSETTPASLLKFVKFLIENKKKCEDIQKSAIELSKPEATSKIISQIQKISE